MKTIEQAQNLVCPFMSTIEAINDKEYERHRKCITTDCMAWVTTKTHEQIEQFVQCGSNDKSSGKNRDGALFPREKCEGFCLRLRR